MQKYGTSEPLEVFRGEEAAVVNSHMRKTGKAVSDFDKKELSELKKDLAGVREAGADAEPSNDSDKDGVNTQDASDNELQGSE